MAIPMEPAMKFAADLAAGNLVRYGAILKDASTGRIVGHLKETGLMESALSGIFGAPGVLLNAASPLSFVAGVAGDTANFAAIRAVGKNVDEVKTIVEGLQLATNVAAFGAVSSLGVSVAGFAYTSQKLKSIESKLDGVASDVVYIKKTLDELRVSWEAMTESKFFAASEALIVAEKAETDLRRSQLAREASAQFAQLRHYYAQLLKERALFESNDLDIDSVWEIVSRYTISCLGLLRAEFILGDLGAYKAFLESVIDEYSKLVSFSAKEVYLARSDSLSALNLDINHQELSDFLKLFADISQENVARMDSHRTELDYLNQNSLSVERYLGELREHETDIVLLRAR